MEVRMLNRRELLRRAAALAPAALLARTATPGAAIAADAAAGAAPFAGRNLVLFITDQERAIQHFPAGWAERNLPGQQRLLAHGVSFDDAVCNACMCSPSRATLLTGQLPAHHGVKYTLEEDMPDDRFPQVELAPAIPNLATTMAAAGYDVVYKGKFHLCKPSGTAFAPSDLEPYGFSGWNPPDAGANQDVEQEGGGIYDHDGRYLNGDDGVLAFLRTRRPGGKPFCLVVSLVNPHDVLLYPRNQHPGGYDDTWLEGEVPLPDTVDESLETKPSVQRRFRALFGLTGALKNTQMKRDYVNFYANLMKHADGMLVQVLDALAAQGLTDDTVIVRTSDHVDLLPTLATLFGAPAPASAGWQGVDYSGLVRGTATRSPQPHTVFTFDDVQAGQSHGPYLKAPNRVVAIREARWKLAETFDGSSDQPSEWELYDRRRDPHERHNLAHPGTRRTREQQQAYARLRRTLAHVKRTELQPTAATPQPRVPA
jgi:arylsulfatase A-like enzyme